MKLARLMIGDIYLEKDVNNEPRLILKDELGEEWVMSSETTGHGFRSLIEKKDKCWYFNEKNRNKKETSFWFSPTQNHINKMKYFRIAKEFYIPRTERQLFFEIENGVYNNTFNFWFSPPFTYRGFELEIKLMWLSFGIRWNLPF